MGHTSHYGQIQHRSICQEIENVEHILIKCETEIIVNKCEQEIIKLISELQALGST